MVRRAALRADKLSLTLGGQSVVDQVSLTASAGEVLAVIGPNGAGKSSLLSLLSGERRPDAGQVWIGDAELNSLSSLALARRRAVLPQTLPRAVGFSVLDIVQLGRLPHQSGGAPTPEDRRAAQQALAQVGMSAFAHRRVETLSGGEHQRIHLARALAQLSDPPPDSPPVLLLDEPTSALDLGAQHQTLELAARLAHDGLVVIVVLHDLNLAARYADRVLLMHRGRAVAPPTPPDALLQPAILGPIYGLTLARHELGGRPVLFPGD